MDIRKDAGSFPKLILIYILWLVGCIFASGLFEVYFLGLGMSFQEIYLANTVWFFAGFVIAPLFNGFSTRNFMIVGVLIMLAACTILYLFPSETAAYAYRIIIGFTHLFFWVPFNTLFYNFRKDNNAMISSVYYAVGPLLSLAVPAIGGLVAAFYGFEALYISAIALFAACLFATAVFIKNKKYKFKFSDAFNSLSGLRTMIFLEGFSINAIMSITIMILTLDYIDKPLEVGVFMSLTMIFSILATFVMAKISDKIKKRKPFIIPVVVGIVLTAIITSQTTEIIGFFLAFGAMTFFIRLFYPLNLALVVDNARSLPEAMIGREFMLNLGRFVGGFVGYVAFVAWNIQIALLIQGIALILIIPLFELKKKKIVNQ
ncbi:MFS transporter [Candidatus Micrarchaeota archaeon]|nr:MFS transporter [Candidatus Micrarchaeota archaeon]